MRIIKRVLIFVALVTFCVLLIVWFWRPGILLAIPNQGHRLGGDAIADLPENTLAAFRRAIPELECNKRFLYSECDLRETSDHEIVIFHDWELGRLIPDTEENRLAIAGADGQLVSIVDQPINELTLAQVKQLRLADGHTIPTLQELLQCAVELKLQKPLILEIKFFHSDIGRQKMIDLARQYRDNSQLEIHFSSFRRNISRSFPIADE